MQEGTSFCKPYAYIAMDVFFLIFGTLFILGDTKDIKALTYLKPIPIWIMMAELFTVREVQKNIKHLMIALAFGSLGDILLLFQDQSFAFFAAGAAAFLIGHLIYVVCFV